jgi:hypothetical protein
MAEITRLEISDAEIDVAIKRGKAVRDNEPHAASARYDRQVGRVIVELTSGCSFAFPPRLAQGLENASDEQLEQVEILGGGYGLHWEALDADFSIPGLLAKIFGTQAYLARRAGKASSPAKSAAARRNGAKGGRPRGTDPGTH